MSSTSNLLLHANASPFIWAVLWIIMWYGEPLKYILRAIILRFSEFICQYLRKYYLCQQKYSSAKVRICLTTEISFHSVRYRLLESGWCFIADVKSSKKKEQFKRKSHKIVEHAQTIRREIADELFECVWPLCEIGAKRVNMHVTFVKAEWHFIDTQEEKLCFTKFSTRNYWNRSLTASDLFTMFMQSINLYCFILKSTDVWKMWFIK